MGLERTRGATFARKGYRWLRH